MAACLLMGRLGTDFLYIDTYKTSRSFIRLACAFCMQGLSGLSLTDEITSCNSVCPHGPTSLNKQTNKKQTNK